MYIQALWINAKANNRGNGLAHLQKLAQMVRDDYGAPSRVYMGVTNGPANLMALGTTFESVADLINGNDTVGQSAALATWSEEAVNYLELATAEWQTFGFLRSGGGMTTNFTQTASVSFRPGHMVKARELLGTLADHYESVYKRPVDILSLEGGLHYRHFIQIGYDDMAQYDADQTALASDPVYAKWAQDVLEHFDGPTIERSIGRWF